jgi:spermidine/putrescine transport system ATP-binding protein
MNNTIIKLEGISISRLHQIILSDISISIRKNEFISLKGPSGCGKTTLLLTISGLEIPDKGRIFINNQLANDPQIILPPYQRDMNLLFQDLALWPHLTGYEQLEFVWESTKIGSFSNRVTEISREIGLAKNLLNKYPSQLSRGEQQRLAIVRTFVAGQGIILLDEPMTALDYNLRQQFLNFLNKVRKMRSATVIIVSHDLMTDSIGYDQEFTFKNKSFIKK